MFKNEIFFVKEQIIRSGFCALKKKKPKILIYIMTLNQNSQMVVEILSTLSPMQHKIQLFCINNLKLKFIMEMSASQNYHITTNGFHYTSNRHGRWAHLRDRLLRKLKLSDL